MAELDDLWGSTLEAVWFDPTAHIAQLVVRVVESDEISRYRVYFERVTEFSFIDENYDSTEPWHYAELTEAHVEVDADGRQDIELILWSESARIKIQCADVSVQPIGKTSSSGTKTDTV